MNFSKEAGWRNTLIDNEQYMDECDYEHLSPFMQIEGHRKELAWRDFAHIDPLGLGRDLGGALLKSMRLRNELGKICEVELGKDGTLDDQLRAVWQALNDDRKRRGKGKVSGYFTAAGVGMDNM